MTMTVLSMLRAWAIAAVVILVWGATFVNARALIGDFSALAILVGRRVRLGT